MGEIMIINKMKDGKPFTKHGEKTVKESMR